MLCIDLGINPKDLRINEQIALEVTNGYIEDKKENEKRNFHFLSDDIVESFDSSKNDPSLQAQIIRDSNKIEGLEENYNNHFERNGD